MCDNSICYVCLENIFYLFLVVLQQDDDVILTIIHQIKYQDFRKLKLLQHTSKTRPAQENYTNQQLPGVPAVGQVTNSFLVKPTFVKEFPPSLITSPNLGVS